MITGGVIYIIATFMRWGGVVLGFRAFYLLILWRNTPSKIENKPAILRNSSLDAVIAAVLLILSGPLLKIQIKGWETPKPTALSLTEHAVNMPLVWPVMTFTGWAMLASVCLIIFGFLRYLTEIDFQLRKSRLQSIFGWALFGVLNFYFWHADPTSSVTFLSGYVPITLFVALSILLLVVATTAIMALTVRASVMRGYAKNTALHIALIAGSFIFALPFAWLVITSFKEDVDTASANGIIWIPKVQQTVKYLSPPTSAKKYFGKIGNQLVSGTILNTSPDGKVVLQALAPEAIKGKNFTTSMSTLKAVPPPDPNYEGTVDGTSFVGDIQSTNSDGTVTINVIHPQSIAGQTYVVRPNQINQVPIDAKLVTAKIDGDPVKAMIVNQSPDGSDFIKVLEPANLKGLETEILDKDTVKVRNVGLRWQNYPDALDFLPPETHYGFMYLQNSVVLVVLNMIGTLLSSSIVAYAFSRMRFPGKKTIFNLVLSTMMLPGAVTLLPQFLIFRSLGWVDTLYPLWVPSFFASAFNIFLLRQFFGQIPMELEDAAKIDGCTYFKTFWSVMVPQIKPALAVIGVWTFMAAWNDFTGPLIYISSPEHMPLSYALSLYNSDHSGQPGMLMAFATMSMLPVLLIFFFAQRYFIEGVTLSGLGGR